jgi:hypothetical protein
MDCSSLNGVQYKGTVLSDAQMALQTLHNVVQAARGMDESDLFMYFGGTAIPQRVLDWAAGRTMNLGLLFCNSQPECADALELEAQMHWTSTERLLRARFDGAPLQEAAKLLAQDHFTLSCGLDAMAHANKGAVGTRLEFLDGVSVAKFHIKDIENIGHVAQPLCRNTSDAYLGAQSRGISVAVARNVQLDTDVSIESIKTHHGEAYGIDVREATTGISVEAEIRNVSGSDGSMELATRSDSYVSSRYSLKKA